MLAAGMMMNCFCWLAASSCRCSSADAVDPEYFLCGGLAVAALLLVALLMALKCSCDMLLLRVGPGESSMVGESWVLAWQPGVRCEMFDGM